MELAARDEIACKLTPKYQLQDLVERKSIFLVKNAVKKVATFGKLRKSTKEK